MKLVINVPDYIKEQADDGKGEEFGIPLWLAYEIANGTPLPKGHGDLIDRKDLLRLKYKWYNMRNGDVACPKIDIEHAPTIIEADKAERSDNT